MRITLPLLSFALFAALMPAERDRANSSMPTSQVMLAVQNGEAFVAYAQALAAFQATNPTFVGTVNAAQLSALRYQFSAQFLATAGNAITATGTSGRVITAYASLPAGSISTVLDATGADASFGTSNGAMWTSASPGASPRALATSVPNGSVVSVVQVGQ